MTITPPTQRRPLAARLALVSTVSLGLIAGPVAIAGPASAMGEDSKKVNCWVIAKKPYLLKIHKEGYYKYAKVDFSFKVKCDAKGKVKFHQWIYKEKNNHRHDRYELVKHEKGEVDVRKNYWEHENTQAKVKKDRKNHVKVFHVVKIVFEADKDDKGKRYGGYDVDRSKTLVIHFPRGY